ncbi:hypothetical protein HDU90_004486 [Geranomyces variabilis]|nr:hypothetical protein HDU90_004486 [Geranomyces variabilis]
MEDPIPPRLCLRADDAEDADAAAADISVPNAVTRRAAAALDFLSNISLGTGPVLGVPAAITEREKVTVADEEKAKTPSANNELPPVTFSERTFTVKEKAAIEFLTNISLDVRDNAADEGATEQSHTFIPNVTLQPSLSGGPFPDLGTSFASQRSQSKTFYPPAYQIYSGEVIAKQRPSNSRRSSIADANGALNFPSAMLGSRVMIATSSGVPMSVFSVIPHKDEKSRPRRRRTRSFKYFGSDYFEKIKLNVDIDAIKRRKFAQSFGTLLEPALTLEPKSAENSLYHPFFLDDPELRTGKHRTVITLPCFVSSIIQHSKPSDIKKELNERFRETHPTVNPTLTLTQIRRLKERLQKIAEMQNLELSSVACSYVYFEKLNMVSKESRRLVAAVCLLLAAKVNDPKELDYTKLLDSFEKVLDISRKDVLANEFLIYTALEFTLYIPLWEVMPHLERIIEASGSLHTMPPKGSHRFKKTPALDAFMETDEGVKLFDSLAMCADGIRGLSDFIHQILPLYIKESAAAAGDSSEGGGDGKRKKKKKKDPTQPKKPPTPYLLYLNGIRSTIVAENPGIKAQEIVAEGGRRWKATTPEERIPFEQEAEIHRRKWAVASRKWREENGLPPQSTAAAKKYAAMDAEDLAAEELAAQGSDEDESDSEDEEDGDEEEEEEEETPAPAPAPTKPAAKATKEKAVAKSKAAAAPAPASPAAKPAKPAKVPRVEPSPAKNVNGAKRKAEEATASASPAVTAKKAKKKNKTDAGKKEASDASKSPKAATGEPFKRKPGRPPKAKQ